MYYEYLDLNCCHSAAVSNCKSFLISQCANPSLGSSAHRFVVLKWWLFTNLKGWQANHRSRSKHSSSSKCIAIRGWEKWPIGKYSRHATIAEEFSPRQNVKPAASPFRIEGIPGEIKRWDGTGKGRKKCPTVRGEITRSQKPREVLTIFQWVLAPRSVELWAVALRNLLRAHFSDLLFLLFLEKLFCSAFSCSWK